MFLHMFSQMDGHFQHNALIIKALQGIFNLLREKQPDLELRPIFGLFYLLLTRSQQCDFTFKALQLPALLLSVQKLFMQIS